MDLIENIQSFDALSIMSRNSPDVRGGYFGSSPAATNRGCTATVASESGSKNAAMLYRSARTGSRRS